MTAYSRLIGKEYISKILTPTLNDIIANIANGVEYEVDPENLEKKSKLADNITNLKIIIHQLMESILNSTQFCPLPIRNIANCLQEAIMNKFPESKYSVIGGFYFLRFFCPIVISPDGFQIVGDNVQITTEVRRVLVLVSKVIQSIANEKEFSEEYMQPFNQLVKEYREVTSYFCNTLSKVPPPNSMQNDYVPSFEITWDTYVDDLEYIKSTVLPKLDQIKEALSHSMKGKKREIIKNILQDLSTDVSLLPTAIESDKTLIKEVFIKARPIKLINGPAPTGGIGIGLRNSNSRNWVSPNIDQNLQKKDFLNDTKDTTKEILQLLDNAIVNLENTSKNEHKSS